MLAAEELYVLTVVDLGGNPRPVLTGSRDQGVQYFMQTAYAFAHLIPRGVLRVVGEENECGLPTLTGLHLLWDAGEELYELAALTRPSRLDSAATTESCPFAGQDFTEIARALDAAVKVEPSLVTPAERARLKSDPAAHTLARRNGGLLFNFWDGDAVPAAHRADIIKTWNAMASVQLTEIPPKQD